MLKAFSVLVLALTISGCQNLVPPADYNSSTVGMRCWVTDLEPTERDYVRYVQRYAGYGNPGCQASLGVMYRRGSFGFTQDFSKARALLVASAGQYQASNAALGEMAEFGEGEPVDYVKARALYRLSERSGVMQLGRLLESGKGGPQDLPGALELYMQYVVSYDDDAWKAAARLAVQGVALSERQKQRYEDFWLRAFWRDHQSLHWVRDVFEVVNALGVSKEVTLFYVFKLGNSVPTVTLINSSGDADLDRVIIHAASLITRDDFAPVMRAPDVLQIKVPLVLSPRSTDGMRWICGRKLCS